MNPNRIPVRAVLLAAVSLLATCLGAAPIIGQQPGTVIAESGQNAVFTVAATGASGLSYEWRHAGVPIPGAVSSSLTLTGVEMADAGFYDVVVSEGGESTTSASGRLIVSPVGGYPDTLRLDTDFAPLFEVEAGSMQRVAPDATGGFYVAGLFSSIGGQPRSSIAHFLANGSLDPDFAPVVRGTVADLVVDGDGRVVIVGSFDRVGSTICNQIARLLPDGSVDSSFVSGGWIDGSVTLVQLAGGGKIVIGGLFTRVNGVARRNVARLNPDGSADLTFDSGTGFDNTVLALLVQPDGKVLVGGYFRNVDGVARSGLARLNTDGSVDLSFNVGTGLAGASSMSAARTFGLYGNGDILVGGAFESYNGWSCRNLVRLHSDGSRDETFLSVEGSGPGAWVFSVAVQPDGSALLAGWFEDYLDASVLPQRVQCPHLIRVNADGSLDRSFPANQSDSFGPSTYAEEIVPVDSGAMLVVGSFSKFSGEPANGVVRLSEDGTVSWRLQEPLRSTGSASALVPVSDAKWVVAGNFSSVNGVRAPGIVRLNSDGSVDGSFIAGDGFDRKVSVLAATGDGKILAAGSFTSYDGSPALGVTRLMPGGARDTTFVSPLEDSPLSSVSIETLALQSDGKLLIGGRFFRPIQFAAGLLRLLPDGREDSSWNDVLVRTGSILCVANVDDGRTLFGGYFDTLSGDSYSCLGLLDNGGGLETIYPTIEDGESVVRCVATLADGRLLAAKLRSPNIGSLQCFAADGNYAGEWSNALASSSAVNYLLPQADGRVVLGNGLYRPEEGARRHLTRIDSNGQPDSTFAAYDIRASGPMAWTDDGRLLVAGASARRGAVTQSGLVMLRADAAPLPTVITTAPATQTATVGSMVSLTVTAAGEDLRYQWLKDGIEVPNAFSPVLVFQHLRPDDFGAYSVRVTGLNGAVTSQPAVLGVSGVAGARYRILDHFRPLVAGNEWLFTPSFSDPQNTHMRERIVSLDTSVTYYTGRGMFPDSHQTSAIELLGEDGYFSGGTLQVRGTWTNYLDSDGVRCGLLGSRDAESGVRTMTDGTMFFPESLALGESRTVERDFHEGGVWSGTMAYGVRLIGLESVTTPAGTFADCLRVRIVSSKVGNEVQDEWWARGVGTVQIRYSDPVNPPVTYSLVSYSVQQPVLPSITVQPADVRVGEHGLANVSVQASGTAPLAYQWFREGSDVPMANFSGPSLVVSAPDAPERYWVRVSNRSGIVDSRAALVETVPATQAFADWIAESGVPSGQRDPLDAPAGDGVSNLLKYVLGVQPLTDASGSLPRLTLETQVGQPPALVLVFNRSYHSQDVRLILEVSENLVTWTEVDSELEVVAFNPRGTEIVRLRETAPVAAPRRFARLKVELVAP